MRLPEYCATHSLKEFMEMVAEPVTTEKINSTEFPRAKRNGWLEEELASNPNHETNMFLTKGFQEAADVFDGPEQECHIIDKICKKGMTKDTCPYNPWLGCDCGANLPTARWG